MSELGTWSTSSDVYRGSSIDQKSIRSDRYRRLYRQLFVVLPLPATSRCSLMVGKIEEGVREGDEFKVLWYTQE